MRSVVPRINQTRGAPAVAWDRSGGTALGLADRPSAAFLFLAATGIDRTTASGRVFLIRGEAEDGTSERKQGLSPWQASDVGCDAVELGTVHAAPPLTVQDRL